MYSFICSLLISGPAPSLPPASGFKENGPSPLIIFFISLCIISCIIRPALSSRIFRSGHSGSTWWSSSAEVELSLAVSSPRPPIWAAIASRSDDASPRHSEYNRSSLRLFAFPSYTTFFTWSSTPSATALYCAFWTKRHNATAASSNSADLSTTSTAASTYSSNSALPTSSTACAIVPVAMPLLVASSWTTVSSSATDRARAVGLSFSAVLAAVSFEASVNTSTGALSAHSSVLQSAALSEWPSVSSAKVGIFTFFCFEKKPAKPLFFSMTGAGVGAGFGFSATGAATDVATDAAAGDASSLVSTLVASDIGLANASSNAANGSSPSGSNIFSNSFISF
mmetsp:Transcript_53063/g.99428  ORF Transcript_53063/g.99428 Transcript_53063/m.99428 type:complete len:339 (+) Transcript_53063:834-1850(+)